MNSETNENQNQTQSQSQNRNQSQNPTSNQSEKGQSQSGQDSELTYSKIRAKRKALTERKLRLEAELARLTDESRKAETHCKIQLGGWILACAKAAHKQKTDFKGLLETFTQFAKIPSPAKEFLADYLAELDKNA